MKAINSYSFFEIQIDSSGITNTNSYKSKNSLRPYIAFKAASSNCGFSNITEPFGFGLSTKSNFSSSIAKNNNKINFLNLDTRPSSTINGSSRTIYGDNVTSKTIQSISLLYDNNNQLVQDSDTDIVKLGIFKGSFLDQGQTRGWKYYIESYKL